MNKYLIASFLLLVGFNSFAQQNTFSVVNVGAKYTFDQLSKSINEGEWCGYYFANENHQIKFDDGSIVEFESASTLKGIKDSCVSEKFEDNRIYYIHSNGMILIKATKKEVKKQPTSR